jgi:hypothetical protein
MDGEVTQKRSKAAGDCVKIEPPLKNIKKIQMCISVVFRRYLTIYQ